MKPYFILLKFCARNLDKVPNCLILCCRKMVTNFSVSTMYLLTVEWSVNDTCLWKSSTNVTDICPWGWVPAGWWTQLASAAPHRWCQAKFCPEVWGCFSQRLVFPLLLFWGCPPASVDHIRGTGQNDLKGVLRSFFSLSEVDLKMTY